MKDLGKQIATQTYQALLTEESPLVTKTDHARLQNDMTLISSQLTKLIQMFSQGQESTGSSAMQMEVTLSPPRNSKRLKQNTTPQKVSYLGDLSTQESDVEVASATSCHEEGMEGCED